MGIQTRKVDLNIVKGDRDTLSWTLTETIDGVTSPYPTVGKVYSLEVFNRDATPVLLFPKITPATDQGLGYVSFELQSPQTAFSGVYDYFLWEEVGVTEVLTIAYGSITFLDLSKYVPFRDFVTAETPGGLVIPELYINAKSLEYRSIFKLHTNSALELANANDETTWPLLYNMLIAKLVVHDFLLRGLKASLVQGADGEEGNTANVKSIETGPSKVEFQDSLRGLSTFMKTTAGENAMDALRTDICGLASGLKIHLGICKARNNPVVSLKGELPTDPDAIEILNKYY